MIFQEGGMLLYEKVMWKVQEWGFILNLMYVVGVIYLEKFVEIWSIVFDYFLLVFGVGVQGGIVEFVI